MNSIADLVSSAMPYAICHRDTLTAIAEIVLRMTPPVRACEIGSARGGSALVILGAMEMAGGGHLTCIDDFKAMSGVEGRKEWDRSVLPDFVHTLKDFITDGRLDLITAPSWAASRLFGRNEFDFVFIDGSHTYEDCKQDIEEYWDFLKPGGVICGDDYVGEPGVKNAVDEFFDNQHQILGGYLWYFKND